MKFPVSLVIITLNEEDGIARAIQSAPFCSEVIVLDSGSTDKTVEIAKSLGARVFTESWRGFRAQKERATELASHDWVLSLDGDECVGDELNKEMMQLLSSWKFDRESPSNPDGVMMPRLSWNLGRWIRHGGWYPDYQLRLYDRRSAKWVGGKVHERVEAVKTLKLKAPLLHYPFKNHAEQVATNNRYSGLGAEALFEKGERVKLPKLFLKPVSKFIETYVFKRGFLDGLPGFIIAVGAAYSIFLKYVKLWELSSRATQARENHLRS